jgi:hypothetical protein
VDREKVVLLHSKDKGATGIFDGISAGSTFERVTWVETKERKKKNYRHLLLGKKQQ